VREQPDYIGLAHWNNNFTGETFKMKQTHKVWRHDGKSGWIRKSEHQYSESSSQRAYHFPLSLFRRASI